MKILYFLLRDLSLLYKILVKTRFILYKTGIFKSTSIDSITKNIYKRPFIICVGNITSGGTGKTSMVIKITRYFLEQGKKVVILTRGYKRKYGGEKYLILSSETKYSVIDTGDEPYLLSNNLNNVPVIIGPERTRTARIAVEKYQPDIIILDDGFQHVKLSRNFNIVLIDCLNPFGCPITKDINNIKEEYLPLGFLREPLSGLSRADMIVLTHSDLIEKEKIGIILNRIKGIISRNAPMLLSRHKPVNISSFLSSNKIELEWLKNREISLMAGIGNPESFEKTALELKSKISKKYIFNDHHWYNLSELKNILVNSGDILTTQKDAVKIEIFKEQLGILLNKLFILNIDIEVMNLNNPINTYEIRGEYEWLKMITKT